MWKENFKNKKVTWKTRKDGTRVKTVKITKRPRVVKKVVKKVVRPRYRNVYYDPWYYNSYTDPWYYKPQVVVTRPNVTLTPGTSVDVPQGYNLNPRVFCALNQDCYPCNPLKAPYETEYCRGSIKKPEKCTPRDIMNGRKGCYPIYSYP